VGTASGKPDSHFHPIDDHVLRAAEFCHGLPIGSHRCLRKHHHDTLDVLANAYRGSAGVPGDPAPSPQSSGCFGHSDYSNDFSEHLPDRELCGRVRQSSSSYGNPSSFDSGGTLHTLTLTELIPGTTYHAALICTNSSSMSSTWQDFSFTTN